MFKLSVVAFKKPSGELVVFASENPGEVNKKYRSCNDAGEHFRALNITPDHTKKIKAVSVPAPVKTVVEQKEEVKSVAKKAIRRRGKK